MIMGRNHTLLAEMSAGIAPAAEKTKNKLHQGARYEGCVRLIKKWLRIHGAEHVSKRTNMEANFPVIHVRNDLSNRTGSKHHGYPCQE
jgi:hypothetical protein